MSKGHYNGGGTLVGPSGSTIGKRPKQGGQGVAAAVEIRRKAKAKKAEADNLRFKAIKKLLPKLEKQWKEENDLVDYQRLPIDSKKRSLATALQEASVYKDAGRGMISKALQLAILKYGQKE